MYDFPDREAHELPHPSTTHMHELCISLCEFIINHNQINGDCSLDFFIVSRRLYNLRYFNNKKVDF